MTTARTVPAAQRSAIREVVQALDGADELQLAKVVAFVDALPKRGEADTLIAPIRHRLWSIRPARPLSFARLLFVPLDPVIMPAAEWRRGRLGIPRTALTPIAAQVRHAWGRSIAEIETALVGRTTEDQTAILSVGSLLWPRAATIVSTACISSDWTSATGLGPRDHADIMRIVALVLSMAPETEKMIGDSAQGIRADPTALKQLALETSDAGVLELGTLLALLLDGMPSEMNMITSAMASTIGPPDPRRHAAVDAAIDFTLDSMETQHAVEPTVAKAAERAGRFATLLDEMESSGNCLRAPQKSRAERLRREVDVGHRKQFSRQLAAHIMTVCRADSADTSAPSTEAIERSMRDLRRLEGAARRIGGSDHYDRQLSDAAARIASAAIPLIERVRLVELIDGPEAALALLSSASGLSANSHSDQGAIAISEPRSNASAEGGFGTAAR